MFFINSHIPIHIPNLRYGEQGDTVMLCSCLSICVLSLQGCSRHDLVFVPPDTTCRPSQTPLLTYPQHDQPVGVNSFLVSI